MMAIRTQFRTQTNIYLFKALTESEVILKVYDIARKLISKTSITASQLNLPKIDLTNPSALLQRIDPKSPVSSQPIYSIPTLEECLKEIEKVLALVKPKVLFESKELERLTCSITLEVFKDPVIDNHGHTFEKSAIETHLKNTKECPVSRQPIETLTPNLAIRESIEHVQSKDPIPTRALFKNDNRKLADNNLNIAKDYIDAQEYDEALSAYSKAFQYTNKWTDYKLLPPLFEQMGLHDKARLAYLYLIQYQLQDQQPLEAIATLETLKKKHPEFIQITLLLLKLYYHTQQTTKALELSVEAGKTLPLEHPQEAIEIYQQVITQDPHQWIAYEALAQLYKTSQEKAHILLTGACHAIQQKDHKTALKLCQLAEACDEESFIDRLIELDLLTNTDSIKTKLLQVAALYDKKGLLPEAIKAYRKLAHLSYDPLYYDKIITHYKALNQSAKALKWAARWITLLIERKEWKKGEQVTLETLAVSEEKIPLYHHLETIYTHWNNHQLNQLWGQLGAAYVTNKQYDLAEKIYQKAFQQFNTFEHAIALAEALIQQKDNRSGVQTYYQASSIALLDNRLDNLTLCVKNICRIDPKMEHLDLTQRMILLTQSRLVELSQEVNRLKSIVVLEMAFGKAAWAKYFGAVGVEPPLPPDIEKVLESPCPIWPGKTVQETHLLVLVPQTVNGQPLTLQTLGGLVQRPLQGNATRYAGFDQGQYQDLPAPASHWVLISRDVLPNSRSKPYAEQQRLVQNYAGYQVPNVLDAAVAMFMEYVRSGTRLYSDNPNTYTRCQEKYNNSWQLVVGSFSASGLSVRSYDDNQHFGVGCQRKL